jgi:membrane protein
MNLSATAVHKTQQITAAGRNTGYRAVYTVDILRRSVRAAIEHDVLTVGQATAYSAMVALFPALIVAAAITGLLPDAQPLRIQMALFFDRVLPSNVIPVLDAYFVTSHHSPQTARAILSFQRGGHVDGRLSPRAQSAAPRRLVLETPRSLHCAGAHLACAADVGECAGGLWPHSFGMARGSGRAADSHVGSGSCIRAALERVAGRLGRHHRRHLSPGHGYLQAYPRTHGPAAALRLDWSWRASLPGAIVATILWFLTTLGFGYYVTRFANYSQVYGTLGAAIALMFWLYIIALSVLVGSEFNAQLQQDRIQTSTNARQVE